MQGKLGGEERPTVLLPGSSPNARSNVRRTLRRATLGACAFALASCIAAAPPRGADQVSLLERSQPPKVASQSKTTVVVVALDGVRWQEVFDGVDPKLARAMSVPSRDVVPADELMPNLHQLIRSRGGAIGAPEHGALMVASGPNYVSLPGYVEMLSGRPAACQTNECPLTEQETIADQLADRSGGWAGDVAVIASWAGLAKAAARHPERIVVSAGRSRGPTRHYLRYDEQAAELLDAGARSAAYPGYGDFRPDRFTAAIALRYLKTHRPAFLFVGLGEPDAYAHRGLYGDYLRSLRQADAVIGEIDHLLGEMAAKGQRTTLVVTTDHGRGRRFAGHGKVAPESARVWLVASGAGIAARGYVPAPTTRRLADIAPTLRQLMGIPADTAPGAGSPLDELLGG